LNTTIFANTYIEENALLLTFHMAKSILIILADRDCTTCDQGHHFITRRLSAGQESEHCFYLQSDTTTLNSSKRRKENRLQMIYL